MNSCKLVKCISSLACAISKLCSPDDIALMAVVYTQLGATLATMPVHNELCNKTGTY